MMRVWRIDAAGFLAHTRRMAKEFRLFPVMSPCIQQATLFLSALYFLATAANLPAQNSQDAADADDAERDAALQKAFDQFPLLTPKTTDAGLPDFQTLTLTNPFVVNHERIFGFRFTVSPRSNHEDLVWAFIQPGDFKEWYILAESNNMHGFVNYYTTTKGDYLQSRPLSPMLGSDLILQNLSGDNLNDGQTYLIWFGFGNYNPRTMPLMFTFTNYNANPPHPILQFERLLGLNQLASKPIVNPDNHHTYILLRPMNWERSEQLAQKLGGHLATIRNQAEEDWIFKTFGRYGGERRLLWIGLTDTEKRFHFSWADGESTSYTAWAPHEPNNAGPRGVDYVAIDYPGRPHENQWKVWNNRGRDPIGLPMDGVVEIIPTNNPAAAGPETSDTGNVAVQILPNLTVTSNSGDIELEWPLSASGYILEATTNLSQPFAEFGYSEETNIEAGVIHVIITNPSPQMFFKLKKPVGVK
jgi:hypothetical protein